jgi:uncharacterized surface protein with fasciclin (FAS1) repeats
MAGADHPPLRRPRGLRSTVAALALVLGCAACASGPSSGPIDSQWLRAVVATTDATDVAIPSGGTTGAGCAAFVGASYAPWPASRAASAMSLDPALSVYTSAVAASGLARTINQAEGLTILAPINSAFDRMPSAVRVRAQADPRGLMTTILSYHIIDGRLGPSQLIGTHQTMEGQNITVAGSTDRLTVAGAARVICGNLQAANATIYVVDAVAVPPAN